ncbi:MAG: nucleotide exchange factor GrpE [Candidatus Riflebacteria bacterium]|nr:nucleotide exchange factor GrpE [Candidatus Riflebacteria bacterium]
MIRLVDWEALADLDQEAPEEVLGPSVPGAAEDLEPLGESAESILERYLEHLALSREVRRAGKTAHKAALAAEGLREVPATLTRLSGTLAGLDKRLPATQDHPQRLSSNGLAWRLIGAMDGLDALKGHLERGEGERPVVSASILEGLALVQGRLEAALAELGVTRMLTRGGPFDPSLQEAVDTVEHQGPENQVVCEELAGYLKEGKVLRYARVVLSRPPALKELPTVPEPPGQEERPPRAPVPLDAPVIGPVQTVPAQPADSDGQVQDTRALQPSRPPSFLVRLWRRITGTGGDG